MKRTEADPAFRDDNLFEMNPDDARVIWLNYNRLYVRRELMGFKEKGEKLYQNIYFTAQRKSAVRRRIKEFNRKKTPEVLSREQKEEIKAFFSPYKMPNMVFHNYFTERSGAFYAEYTPQDLYVGYIDPYFNDIIAAKYFDNKCMYHALFHDIPQCENVLMRVNGIWLDGNNHPVSLDDINYILKKSERGLFVKEAQTTAGGDGVTYVEKSRISADAIMGIADAFSTDVIVQKELVQHKDMAVLNPNSVNTLRIYSVLGLDGHATVYSAVVRMGVGNTKLDNYSAGGMACGISEDGSLRKYGYSKKGERTETHPSTRTVFEGFRIPSYDKAVALIQKAHPMIPHFRSVSWDIAIDEKGDAILIEANLCCGGIDLLQINNGPLYGKDTKKILDEVFGKK